MQNDEIALVTGASRGIGRAIAKALLAEGIAVAGTATTAAGAERISEELAGEGLPVIGIQLDVQDTNSIAATLRRSCRSSVEHPVSWSIMRVLRATICYRV